MPTIDDLDAKIRQLVVQVSDSAPTAPSWEDIEVRLSRPPSVFKRLRLTAVIAALVVLGIGGAVGALTLGSSQPARQLLTKPSLVPPGATLVNTRTVAGETVQIYIQAVARKSYEALAGYNVVSEGQVVSTGTNTITPPFLASGAGITSVGSGQGGPLYIDYIAVNNSAIVSITAVDNGNVVDSMPRVNERSVAFAVLAIPLGDVSTTTIEGLDGSGAVVASTGVASGTPQTIPGGGSRISGSGSASSASTG